VLGSDPHISDNSARFAEGFRVHDRAHIAVFAQTFTQAFMAKAEDTVATFGLLFALVEENVEGFRDIGEYPSENDGPHVSERKADTGEEVVAKFAVPSRQFLLIEVPVDSD
jgi:hypothetical protein